MIFKLSLFVLFMTLFGYTKSYAQLQGQAKVDSMLAEANKLPLDTNKVNLYQLITLEYRVFNPDSAMKYAKTTYKMANDLNWQKGKTFALFGIGLIHERKNDYLQAIDYYLQSIEIARKINDTNRLAVAYARIGLSYYHLNKYDDALENYFNAEKLWKMVDNKSGLANNFLNIGLIFDDRKQSDKALDYYKQALELFKELNNKIGIANVNMNIGIIHFQSKKYDLALNYTYGALEIFRELNNLKSIAVSYGTLGLIYNELVEFDKAIEYLKNASLTNLEINDERGVNINNANIGMIYYRMSIDSIMNLSPKKNVLLKNKSRNLSKSIELLSKSLDYFESISDLYYRTQFSLILSDAYYLAGNYKKSAEILRLHKWLNDSLNSIEITKQVATLEAVIEQEKQAKEIEKLNLVNDTQMKINLEKERTNKILIFATIVSIVLFIIILVGLYNRYKFKAETNAILAEKNRYITDSINYARNIQHALLPPITQISKFFPEHLILYKPKDIVSGDFYWYGEVDDVGILAVVDCTGHGVPGAFMSMIGSDILFNIVNGLRISNPAEILNLLHIGVRTALKQDTEDSSQMDGMEVCLIAFDKKSSKLTFAGAKRPLWLVKTTKDNPEFIEIKGDKHPIGGHQKEQFRAFTNQEIFLNGESCTLYLTSDGYADQKGQDGTFYRSKRLKKLISDSAQMSMQEQLNKLEQELANHQGNQEQIDDITIIGVKL